MAKQKVSKAEVADTPPLMEKTEAASPAEVPMAKGSVLISLSGGMDSTTLLGMALSECQAVTAIHFQYGSKHNGAELLATREIVRHYQNCYRFTYEEVRMEELFGAMGSNSHLLNSGGAIPEGHYQHETMKQTVVPGRNLIMVSILAAIAESRGIDAIMLGIHSGDHAIYPDCRPEFYEALKQTVAASSDGKVDVLAPFLTGDKITILQAGYALAFPVPYALTRTCYKASKLACGRCGSCQERLLAFRAIGKVDPAPYDPAFYVKGYCLGEGSVESYFAGSEASSPVS